MTDKTWMLDRQKEENYACRAEHLMTEAAKKIIAAYCSRPAKHSYFLGCSGGGRQALKETQRFPEDYDGIVAGAPSFAGAKRGEARVASSLPKWLPGK